jgi:lycopene cyclase domain-containing protein
MQRFEYFIVLILVVIPIIIMMIHKKSVLKGKELIVFGCILISSIPFLIWDYFATQRGHWSFNTDYNTGIYILNLPIEEVLFFVAIPLACLYVWQSLKMFKSPQDLIDYLKN